MNLPGEDRPIRWERRGGKLFCVIGEDDRMSNDLAHYAALISAMPMYLGGYCHACGRPHDQMNGHFGQGGLQSASIFSAFGGAPR